MEHQYVKNATPFKIRMCAQGVDYFHSILCGQVGGGTSLGILGLQNSWVKSNVEKIKGSSIFVILRKTDF